MTQIRHGEHPLNAQAASRKLTCKRDRMMVNKRDDARTPVHLRPYVYRHHRNFLTASPVAYTVHRMQDVSGLNDSVSADLQVPGNLRQLMDWMRQMMQHSDHYNQIDARIVEIQVCAIHQPLIHSWVGFQITLGGL